jgi:AmmeMemoRadiSam system protein B
MYYESREGMNKPVLRRDIQPIVTIIKGRQMIAFHDPYHLTGDSIALDMNTLPLLQLLDGKHDLRDIQAILMKKQGGRIVYMSEIESFIETLDKAYLLDSELYSDKMNKLRSEFTMQQNRFPVHAGKAYMAEPDQLSRFIRDIENNISQKNLRTIQDTITGLLAPHIDIKTAAEVYVNTYRHLKGKHYDLVIILGINHHEQDGLYSVSGKNYLTPYGEIKSNRNFISALKKLVPEGTLTTDDFGHMTEHSIEFQTIFLRHYLGDSFSIVPILCGGIHAFIRQKKTLLDDERFQGMVEAMKTLLHKEKGKALLVAGVDLSHTGKKFGDQLPADAILPQATANDKAILSLLAQGNVEKVYQIALDNQDRYRICGLPAILLMASLLKGNRADILHFDTYRERETQSAVNYASLIFSS